MDVHSCRETDQGYGLQPGFMTPYYSQTEGTAQQQPCPQQNQAKVEQNFGVLKSHFRYFDMSGRLLYSSSMENVDHEGMAEDEEEDENQQQNVAKIAGTQWRNQIVHNFFSDA
ncbi:hypothetical protein NDU88_003986 [Pleurodeles waltl]|uniref:Uncharacterized protein n=1 Tax=Pleurodeles waltl TaxID=8319 RepID=A0AAV7T7V2_PLEWA|nr:hypothetical protein NDU88_003986 [Pleurodeles waltl]